MLNILFNSSKILTLTLILILMLTKILFMIFTFYSYLAIYYIIIDAAVCIIRGYLCNDIKQVMLYHIMKLYVTTCHTYVMSIMASLVTCTQYTHKYIHTYVLCIC